MHLEIENVSKHYKNHTALDQVSFDIPSKSIFGLLGPNGAGKTSLIRIINQITQPDHGQIKLNGELLNEKHIPLIGYLPEERGLYTKMKIWDQMMYFARLRNMSRAIAEDKCNQLMERFDILDWKNKKLEELSKGMQQKVQFIITIMHSPSLIILDEPFTGFDPINTQIIKDEIIGLRDEGATIIFSTHRMESVEEICDRIGMINHSKKVLEGSIAEIKKQNETGRYELVSTKELPELNSDFHKLPNGYYRYEVASNDKIINSLGEMTIDNTLVSFAKEQPSIHEIFIQQVNQENHVQS